MPAIRAQQINGLVGGNRVEPRADRLGCVVLTALTVYLEKRPLKGVLSQSSVA